MKREIRELSREVSSADLGGKNGNGKTHLYRCVPAVPAPGRDDRHAKSDSGAPGQIAPTLERASKGDIVHKGGRHVAEDLLQRLYRRNGLDRDPVKAKLMLEQGQRFQNDGHVAALDGYASTGLVGAGGARGGSRMPISEAAAGARDRLRSATSCMPSDVAKAVHQLLVDGLDAQTVGAGLSVYSGSGERAAAALTMLRIGLAALVENM